MSASDAFDQLVTAIPAGMPIATSEDPIRRLFVDRTLPGGIRLLALAEPVHRTAGGHVSATAALTAFEEAFAVDMREGIESGMVRAFAAANSAVRSANATAIVGEREFAGVTAVVISGNDAVIGCVPPGQALLLQDGRMYGVPELATWSPVYMPKASAQSQEPLGLTPFLRPMMRHTEIQPGDQVVLGSSSVGRVMATIEKSPVAAAPETPVIDELTKAVASTNTEGAYAAWMRVVPPSSTSEMYESRRADIERGWRPAPPTPRSEIHASTTYVDPRMRRAERLDRIHGTMIEASERILGCRGPESLPLEARRRATAPPGATSLERHVQRHTLSLGPSVRCRMPRGMRLPVSKRSLLALAVVLTLIVGTALGYDVRQARANKQDRFLNNARTELQRANQAETQAEIEQHLEAAHDALNDAIRSGADETEIAEWRRQAATLENRLGDGHRIAEMTQIGALPAEVQGNVNQLVMASGQLYLVAESVFAVDPVALSMVHVLEVGETIGSIEVGPIISATVDDADLLVTDGKALFRRTPEGQWNAERLAELVGSNGWDSAACGVYKGNFYLLENDTSPQIKKFRERALEMEPTNWLSDDVTEVIATAVDMTVDRSIYVLTSDGTIHAFHQGDHQTEFRLEASTTGAQFVGLDRGTATGSIYVVETADDSARLTQVDPASGDVVHFLPADYGQPEQEAAATAFAETSDFVIDEAAGIIYYATSAGLWMGQLS